VVQQFEFARQRFLDFHDQTGSGKDFRVRIHHLCASALVFGIRITRAGSRAALDEDFMPALDELIGSARQQRHPIFLFFNLFGNADDHNFMRILLFAFLA